MQHSLQLEVAACLTEDGFSLDELVIETRRLFETEGMAGLIGAVWDDLGRGSIAAWILVLSPYVVIQLFRIAFRLLRRS